MLSTNNSNKNNNIETDSDSSDSIIPDFMIPITNHKINNTLINGIDFNKQNIKFKHNQPKSLSVQYDNTNNLFHFTDNNNNNKIGSISPLHIIKYVAYVYDVNDQFLNYIKNFKTAKNIIKLFICNVKYDKNTKTANINLLDFNKSPFMGDIEFLLKISSQFDQFIKLKLNHELKFIDVKYRKNIELIIKQFHFKLLNYILALIMTISKNLKSDHKLKTDLIKFSVWTVYKISQFVQNQISIAMKKSENIDNLLSINNSLRKIIKDKIDNLSTPVEHQIDISPVNNINSLLQLGGNNYNIDSSENFDQNRILSILSSSKSSEY